MLPSISFVCEPGRLEAQALVLAASLRIADPRLALVAAVPRPIPTRTREILDALNVRIAPICNPVAEGYAIGNKVAALAAGECDGLRVFLDTDTLCLASLNFAALAEHAFAAKSADIATFGDLDIWRVLYRRFGLELPPIRVAASVSEVWSPPYFNAGMIATTRANELATEWAKICRAVDAMEDINPRRPWLDQIALPIAIARLAIDWRVLGEAWNYPAHMKALAAAAVAPTIVHYHQPAIIAREPALIARVAEITRRWAGIRSALARDGAWAAVLHCANAAVPQPAVGWRRVLRPLEAHAVRTFGRRHHENDGSAGKAYAAARAHARDLVISGIPRSGTSYLCKLLSTCDNVAIVNEPVILHEWLRYAPDPYVVRTLHDELRRRIDAGEAVDNKLTQSGELVEDTALADARVPWRPKLRNAKWVLGTKNTLAYMARLEGILRLMPGARVVLCVRHPLDTLASWKGTFAHLAAGDPTHVPVGGLGDPFLPRQLAAGLRIVADMPEAPYRRAAWWRLLAGEVLRFRDRVVIVRYEDLVADPACELGRALGPLAAFAGGPRAALVPSAVRTWRRASLDNADRDAVATQCKDVLDYFGYDVPRE